MPRFEPLPDRRPAIVAGASSGIGAAAAVELAGRGFPVALGARRIEKCQALVGTGVRAAIVHPGPTKTGMGWSLPPESIGPALEDWAKWGQARHDYFLRPADLARCIAFVAETPRGGFIANMEMQPEAPLAS